MMHRIREAMNNATPSPIGGTGKVIEADETVVGGKAKNRAYKPEPTYRVLTLIIRNRLPETIVVTSAKIKRPKGSLISKPEWSSKGGIEIKQPTSHRIDLDCDVAPFGAATVGMPGAPMYADTQRCDLYLLFPTEWTSGIVAIDLSISSRALTLRDKRMVIKRFTTAPPARKIAASANIPS
jgi:hypothetical protein